MIFGHHLIYGRLRVEPVLKDFFEQEALPAAGLEAGPFWDGFAELVEDVMPRNRQALGERDRLQALLDGWARDRRGLPWDSAAHREFLEEIGYLVPAPEHIAVT